MLTRDNLDEIKTLIDKASDRVLLDQIKDLRKKIQKPERDAIIALQEKIATLEYELEAIKILNTYYRCIAEQYEEENKQLRRKVEFYDRTHSSKAEGTVDWNRSKWRMA